MKILLVDDSLKHRRAGKKQLEVLGHEVVPICEYTEAYKLASETKFDAVLLDLLMPAEGMMLGSDARVEYLGKEIDVGFAMVLAMAMTGASWIAVATDTNHHAHPASALVDWFSGHVLTINGSTALIMHSPMCSDGTKDWGKVLARLLANKP